MKLLVLILLFGVWGFYLQAQENDRFSLIEELRMAPDYLFSGPRINYMQGKDGFIVLAFNLGWHETGYLPIKHFGFAVGTDLKLSKSLLMAPKVALE
jgi:hypothetical protein